MKLFFKKITICRKTLKTFQISSILPKKMVILNPSKTKTLLFSFKVHRLPALPSLPSLLEIKNPQGYQPQKELDQLPRI